MTKKIIHKKENNKKKKDKRDKIDDNKGKQM